MTADVDRDFLEAMDPALVPIWRTFPIDRYAAILRSGQAAASQKRYIEHEAATRDMGNVLSLLRYYRTFHPSLVPEEFSGRCWESREDGRWRWAVLPHARPHRTRAAQSAPRLGKPR